MINNLLENEAITEHCEQKDNCTLKDVQKDCLSIPIKGILVDHIYYKKVYQPLDRKYAGMYTGIKNKFFIFIYFIFFVSIFWYFIVIHFLLNFKFNYPQG